MFTHDIDDMPSFRTFTSQLYINNSASQAEICRAFGVSKISVMRSVKLYWAKCASHKEKSFIHFRLTVAVKANGAIAPIGMGATNTAGRLGGLTIKKYIITLPKKEQEALGSLVSKGKHQSQKILNALILLDCETGYYQTNRSTNEEIARVLNISMRKIGRVRLERKLPDGIRAR